MRRLLVLGCLWFAGAALARPTVLVSAPVEGAEFVENLQPAGCKQVAATVAASLAARVARHFPVIDWRTAASGSDAEIVLALVEAPGAGDLPEVKLVWRAKFAAAAPADLAAVQAVDVYDSFDPAREMHDAAELAKVLDSKLAAWFAESARRAEFAKAFVNQVPIVHNVAAQGEQILLPFSMRAEKIDRLSKLVVHFVALDAGTARTGFIDVSDLSETLANASMQTLGGVSKFKFGDGSPVPGWSPKIPALLQNPAKSYVVFEEFILNEAGGNGLLVTP